MQFKLTSTRYTAVHCLHPKVVTPVRFARLWTRTAKEPNVCVAASARAAEAEDDDDDGEAPVAGRLLRVERLLANLGYGKRRECQQLVKKGRVTTRDGGKLKVGDKVCWGDILLEGEDLDPASPLMLALHKPCGYVVTSPDDEHVTDPVVYDLLPYRFGRRRPFLSCVGRLDKDTSGLLLLTDDGTLLHRINSPKRGIWKVYEATLSEPISAKQAEAAARKFASGTLVLEGDYTPLLPAKMQLTGERSARVAICEGRYHQVRRMFAAVGSSVVALHRVSVGALTLGSLPEGEWRYLSPQDLDLVFTGPSAEDIFPPRGDPAGSSAGTSASGGGSPNDVTAVSIDTSASIGSGVTELRDGSTASTSGRVDAASGNSGVLRLTKKEKKKGRKEDVRANKRRERRSDVGGPAGDDEEGEEEEYLEVADVELLEYDSGDEEGEEGIRAAGGGSGGRRGRRQQPRRPPAVRQGVVLDAYGDEEGQAGGEQGLRDGGLLALVEEDEGDMVRSAGAGSAVRKYRDGAKWWRRRDALKQLLPS